MSEINHECIIANTWNIEVINKFETQWLCCVPEKYKHLFQIIPGVVNNRYTIFFAPSGSKKGWEYDIELEKMRKNLILFFKTFDYEDGSNPINWVEVGFGEYGQTILDGNNKNHFDDSDYYGRLDL